MRWRGVHAGTGGGIRVFFSGGQRNKLGQRLNTRPLAVALSTKRTAPTPPLSSAGPSRKETSARFDALSSSLQQQQERSLLGLSLVSAKDGR